MNTRHETAQTLAGLCAALVIALLGIIGATAGLGYMLVLAVAPLYIALMFFAAKVTVGQPAATALPIGANAVATAVKAPSMMETQLEVPLTPSQPVRRHVPVALLLLMAGLALLPEMGLISVSGNIAVMPALLGCWIAGLALVLIGTRSEPKPAETIALMGGGSIAVVTLAAALTGNITGVFSVIMGMGYVLTFAFGYTLYRLDRAGRPAVATGRLYTQADMQQQLRRIEMFARMSDEQRATVAAIAHTRHFESGEVMGMEGHTTDSLYCIISGQMELSVGTAIGELTVKVAGPGESLPLSALLEPHTLVTTAIALSDVTVLMLPRNQLLDLCARRTDIGMVLFAAAAEVLGGRYRATLRRLTQRLEIQEPALWANV